VSFYHAFRLGVHAGLLIAKRFPAKLLLWECAEELTYSIFPPRDHCRGAFFPTQPPASGSQPPMNQPIAGVTPSELTEVTCKVVWPTIGATPVGRLVGRLADVRWGVGKFFTLGKLLALATIPLSLGVFAWQLMPYVCRRYALTNRRIIIRKGLMPLDERWIGLEEFDAVELEVLPGQEWLHAGEVVFKRSGVELLRLSGVPRPEIFRRVCLTARDAYSIPVVG
jgi:hypothetical protein